MRDMCFDRCLRNMADRRSKARKLQPSISAFFEHRGQKRKAGDDDEPNAIRIGDAKPSWTVFQFPKAPEDVPPQHDVAIEAQIFSARQHSQRESWWASYWGAHEYLDISGGQFVKTHFLYLRLSSLLFSTGICSGIVCEFCCFTTTFHFCAADFHGVLGFVFVLCCDIIVELFAVIL